MRFVLTLELGNDAMSTRGDISEVLRKLAVKLRVECVGDPQVGNAESIRDDNGNTVGGWHVEG